MNMNSFRVDIRLNSKSPSVKAYADLHIEFPGGSFTVFGLSVIEKDGKPAWVAFPSRPGNIPGKYFPVVEADGDVRRQIADLVLEKYREAIPV